MCVCCWCVYGDEIVCEWGVVVGVGMVGRRARVRTRDMRERRGVRDCDGGVCDGEDDEWCVCGVCVLGVGGWDGGDVEIGVGVGERRDERGEGVRDDGGGVRGGECVGVGVGGGVE